MKKATFIISAFLLTFIATEQTDAQEMSAVQARVARQQEMVGKPAPVREEMTPEKIAEQTAKRLSERLNLSDKQYKKVYKLYLARAEKMSENAQGGQPEGGYAMRGPGMGGQRGGHAMRSGGPGMRGGNMGGERMRDGNRPGERPDAMPMMPAESEKDIAARDKKMKKILDDEQYSKWSRIEKEMLVRQSWMHQGRNLDNRIEETPERGQRRSEVTHSRHMDISMLVPMVEVIDEPMPVIIR